MNQEGVKMMKKILTISIVLVLVAVLAVPMAVFAADNDAGQGASTAQATTINIVGQVADTAGLVCTGRR